MLESNVEQYLQDEITRHGGLSLNFMSPSNRGVPDQIVLYQGSTYFVEMKAPKQRPRKSQQVMHKKFEEQGIMVYILDTHDKVDHFIKETLKAKPIPVPKETFKIKKNMFNI